ncbi:MAG: hypothetical protein HKL85_08340 [Acidimicrobiaceae bacterium]|nr:hypothetical protein [Acidimicrobiaceae bacterium]
MATSDHATGEIARNSMATGDASPYQTSLGARAQLGYCPVAWSRVDSVSRGGISDHGAYSPGGMGGGTDLCLCTTV